VEAPEGVRFLIRSRLLTDEEWWRCKNTEAVGHPVTRAGWPRPSTGRRVPHKHPSTARTRAVDGVDCLTGSWTAPSAPDARWTNWSPLEVSWSLWGETMLGTGGRRARTVAIW
jgi:hypothetical protein